MANLVEGRYVAARTLKSLDVVCTSIQGGIAAEGVLFAFTKNEALMLGPLQADQDEINTRFNARLFDYLHSRGQRSFVGTEGNFQRPTGRKVEKKTVLQAGFIIRVINEKVDELEIYSPCPTPT
ncbi:hypothetical protein [Pseudomonas sp. nanlin1]|uniref:hypothetical protein n=1 Tax=Pseudomonas sp. nanlin1 TaxID=3040605 RepID=UPI00388D1C23